MLAFWVLRRLTGAFWTSAFSAALFAWHPLRVESVVWITERKDVMSGCFFLLTIWAYAAYVERRKQGRPAWRFYLLTLALFIAGLMSKPVLVALPIVLLVLDFWPLRRVEPAPRHSWRGPLLEKVPFFALSAVIAVVTLVMQRHEGAFILKLSLDARLGNAVVSTARYVGKFFWPFHLTAFYPHPGYWPAWNVVGAALLSIGITAAAWWQLHARPWLAAGWLWFLAMLFPVAGIVQAGGQAMADRYTYIPILGLQLALLWTLRQTGPRACARWAAGAIGGALLAGCAARAWDQQFTWRDSIALLQHAIKVTKRNDAAHGFLGYAFASLGRTEEAMRHSELALEINPENEWALFALAQAYEKRGQVDKAIDGYRALLRVKPTDTGSEYRLGLLLLRRGRFEEAVAHMESAARQQPDFIQAYRQIARTERRFGRPGNAIPFYTTILALNPDDAEAHFEFGLALSQLGRTDEALAHYETAARLQPDHAGAHTEAGFILLERRQLAEAAAQFRSALASRPELALPHVGLGRAVELMGRTMEATPSFERAIECEPDNPMVHRAWAETLARRGRFADAVQSYERAVQLQPDDPGNHAGLGYALFLSGRREEGIAQWEKALQLDPNFPGLRERLGKARK